MSNIKDQNVLQRAWARLTGQGNGGQDRPVNVRSLDSEVAQLTRQGPSNGADNGRAAQQYNRPLTGGPGRIPRIIMPVEEPLIFEFRPGVNLISQPRAGFGLMPFGTLKQLAELCMEIRLPIELLKREIRALEWSIVPKKDVVTDVSDQVEAGRELLRLPDGVTPFDGWVNMLVEETLVTDAATIYPQRNRGGQVLGFEAIDGATIRPLLDNRGRVPFEPMPAYIQTIRGLPVGQWTRGELWYMPYNTNVRHPYGLPPVELVVMTVNTALRRAMFQMNYYTEGNVPEALVGLPSDWNVEQIEAFQEYWDTLLAGDLEKLRRLKFMPTAGSRSGSGGLAVHEFKRPENETKRDEWLLRVGCWAVGVSPAEFGLVPGGGLGGKGFSEGQSDVQYRMGLGPMAQHIKGVCDRALAEAGIDAAEFNWVSLRPAEDALKQAQIDEIYVRSGIRTPQGIAQERGFDDGVGQVAQPGDVTVVTPYDYDPSDEQPMLAFFRPRQLPPGGAEP